MKKRNINTSIALCAQRILPVIQGIFEWNGELFACPYVTLDDKKKPLRISTWNKEFKNRKNIIAHLDNEHNFLIIFADPIDPKTYQKMRMHTMDKNLGIDKNTKVYLNGNLSIKIQNGLKIDTLKFVRKISDAERTNLFPQDNYTCRLKTIIWRLSKPGANLQYGMYSLKNALEEWDKLMLKTG